jgi:hypothetical protein
MTLFLSYHFCTRDSRFCEKNVCKKHAFCNEAIQNSNVNSVTVRKAVIVCCFYLTA